MKVRDVCTAVERLAPRALALSWDKPGLTIGDPNAEVTSLVVALTVTRETLDAARDARAEMIVSHHPVIWTPLATLRQDDPVASLCLDLVRANIACYAAHTNLDVAPGGVNDVLAEKLGLLNTRPLLPAPQAAQLKLVTFVPEAHLSAVRDAVCRAGAGVIGKYTHCSFSTPGTGTFLPGDGTQAFSGQRGQVNEEPERRFEVLVSKALLEPVLVALREAHPYEEVAYDIVMLENRDPNLGLGVCGDLPAPVTLAAFARHVRAALALSHVRVVGTLDALIQRVGVLGGSGGDEVCQIPPDVDVYLTGDIKYHDAVNAHLRGTALIDVGHSGAEKWVIPVLADFLRKELESVRVAIHEDPELFVAVVE